MMNDEQKKALGRCFLEERIRRLQAYVKVGTITRAEMLSTVAALNAVAADQRGYLGFQTEARSRADLGDFSSCTFHFAPEKD